MHPAREGRRLEKGHDAIGNRCCVNYQVLDYSIETKENGASVPVAGDTFHCWQTYDPNPHN